MTKKNPKEEFAKNRVLWRIKSSAQVLTTQCDVLEREMSDLQHALQDMQGSIAVLEGRPLEHVKAVQKN